MSPIRLLSNAEYDYLAQVSTDSSRALSTTYLSQYLARPDVAEYLSQNQRAYPHLTPGANLALSKAGQGPDTPAAIQVANATAERKIKKGGGWSDIGEILSTPLSFIGKAIGFVGAVQPIPKSALRYPLAGLNTLSEGVDVLAGATARNIQEKGIIGGLTSQLLSGSSSIPATMKRGVQPATTSLGISLQEPSRYNLGSGYMPTLRTSSGEPSDEQAKRARSIYEIDGHAATLGRLLAREVFEPGTTAYNRLSGLADAATDIFLDPAAKPLRAATAARTASRLLDPAAPSSLTFAERATSKLLAPIPRQSRESIGLLETPTRWSVDDNVARAWAMTSNPGKKFVEDARIHTETQYFRETYGLPLEVSRDLADTRTDSEVLDAFSRHFESGVLRDKPNPKLAPTIRPSARFRLAGAFPREQYALRDDLDQAATQLEAHLRNAGIRGSALNTYIDRLARVPDDTMFPTRNAAFDQIFKDAFSDIADRMAGQVDAFGTIIGGRKLTLGDKVYLPDSVERGEVVSAPFTKTVTALERVPGVRTPREISGEELYVRVRTPSSLNPVEVPLTALSVHLPATKLRTMLKVVTDDLDMVTDDITDELATDSPRLGVLDDSELLDLDPAHDMAETLNGAIFLPDIREIRGLTSSFGRVLNNSALSIVPRTFDAFYRAWRPIKILTGAAMVRNIGEGQVRMATAGIRPPTHPLQIISTIIARGSKSRDEEWLTGSQELQRLLGHTSRAWLDNQSRNASQLIRPYDVSFPTAWADEVANYHTEPTMQRLAGNWDDLPDLPRSGNNLLDTQAWFWDHEVPRLRAQIDERYWPGYLKSRGAANKKVEEYQSHLEHITRGDTKLLESIAYGTIDGNPAIISTENGFEIADTLAAYTRSHTGLPNTPTWIKAPAQLPKSKRGVWDGMVNALFRNLYDHPTEKLVIIPTFRGYYFQRARELLPSLTREAQEQVVKLAKTSGLSRAELRTLAHSMLKKTGELSFDEFDVVAKSHASDASRKLLYEFQAKRQFGDAYRHFVPFYDAWRDMVRTYPKLLAKNPLALRRMQVTVQGARGNDADPGTGFFHLNEETGEEVFSVPFSAHLTQGLTSLLSGGEVSARLPLVHNVKNLNQFSHTLLPGVGPVIQWPVSRLIPNRPDLDWLHQTVNPVGQPNLSGTITSPWMSNIIRGFTADRNKDRNYANTEADAWRYVLSTGQYDLDNESDMRAAGDKATKLAKSMYYIRSLVGWIAPSQPSPEWRAYDNDGRLLSQFKMSQIFHDMAADPEIGYDKALMAFVANFGEKNILLLQSTSTGTSPDNEATYDWMRENPQLVADYPDAYNFFAPRNDIRAPYEAYLQSFKSGERRLLSEREWLSRANDRLGSMLYYSAKDAIGPQPAKNQSTWLRQYRDFLRQKYPGFDPGPTDSARTDRVIEQLYEAANDGLLASTNTGKGIALYLSARDAAIDQAAKANIVNWGQAKSTRNIRAWLRDRAREVQSRYPDFERVWDQVFSREMQEDE